jgi:stage V sporulation protein G
MQITDVKIYPFDTGDKRSNLRAFADVTLDDTLVLKGIKILEGKQGGLFIGFPAQKGRDNKYHDYIIVKSPEFKNTLREQILQAYREFV